MMTVFYLFIIILVVANFAVCQPDLSTRARVRNRMQMRQMDPVRSNPLKFNSTLDGNYGIDISGQMCDGSDWKSATEFPCFRSAGKSFAIVETIQGGYGYTTSIKYCTSQAVATGMSVSVYAFMCPNCKGNTPAADVAQSIVQRLQSEGVTYTYFYVDVEQCSGCWNSAAENVAFLQDVVRGAQAGGANVAIYTNANEWSQVCGSDSSFSSLPLWYAHYDGIAGFSDFRPFAGWTSPQMKQYNDHSDAGCFNGVDVNWQP